MDGKARAAEERCRVWVVRYSEAAPAGWHDIPPGAVAIEPAEGKTMTLNQARRYVEAFNRAALGGARKIWAIALPVRVRYDGDPRPGELVDRREGNITSTD